MAYPLDVEDMLDLVEREHNASSGGPEGVTPTMPKPKKPKKTQNGLPAAASKRKSPNKEHGVQMLAFSKRRISTESENYSGLKRSGKFWMDTHDLGVDDPLRSCLGAYWTNVEESEIKKDLGFKYANIMAGNEKKPQEAGYWGANSKKRATGSLQTRRGIP